MVRTKGTPDSRVSGKKKLDIHSDTYSEVWTPYGTAPVSEGKVIKVFKVTSGKNKGKWRIKVKKGRDTFEVTDLSKDKPKVGEMVAYIHATHKIMYFSKDKKIFPPYK